MLKKMKREEFDKILYQTLIKLGEMPDAMQDKFQDFDFFYEQMKHFSAEQFEIICAKGISNYIKDTKSSGLN